MREKWELIPQFNERYKISNLGHVFDLLNNREIKPHMSGVKRRNYYQVTLYKKVGQKTTKHTKRVHSLMAITFLGHKYNGERKLVVDHIDNNPLNNNLSNLQIVTMQINNTKDKKNDNF
jgi:hypothetical protein